MEERINRIAIAAAVALISVPLTAGAQLDAVALLTHGNSLHNPRGSSGRQA